MVHRKFNSLHSLNKNLVSFINPQQLEIPSFHTLHEVKGYIFHYIIEEMFCVTL